MKGLKRSKKAMPATAVDRYCDTQMLLTWGSISVGGQLGLKMNCVETENIMPHHLTWRESKLV